MAAIDKQRGHRPLKEDEHALWQDVTRPKKTVTPSSPVPKSAPPPLAPLARRLKQRVARGTEPIESRIDLHGLTQAQAHHALLRFLRNAQADGARMVLVITGKGARGDDARGHGEDRGVLKRQVPHWLRLPEFRPYVIGFADAGVGHGGEGALYVQVRRGRRGD
jgi:DNA-nicking Smr family endonuclease